MSIASVSALALLLAVLITGGALGVASAVRDNAAGIPETVVLDEGLAVYRTRAAHVATDDQTGARFVDNELLVTVHKGVAPADVKRFVSRRGGKIVGYDEWLRKYQIQLDSAYTLAALEALQTAYVASGFFSKARTNLVVSVGLGELPNDGEWAGRWGTSDRRTWGAEAIGAPGMWAMYAKTEGQAVNVGVLDLQFYAEHEDLHFAGTDANAYNPAREHQEHGTHVAGTLAATFDNGKGIAGIAPRVNLYGVSARGLYNERREDAQGITVSDWEAGLTYLICVKRCKVINVSVTGGRGVFSEIEAALLFYVEEYAFDFLLVSAAGNGDAESHVPQDASRSNLLNYISNPKLRQRIVVVGAAKRLANGAIRVAEYSNKGARVDLIAPGSDIYSTVPVPARFWTNSGYAYSSGTSMAAPHVAGVAAVMWSVNPNLTGPEVKRLLCETASGDYGYEDAAAHGDTYKLLDAFWAVAGAAAYLPDSGGLCAFPPEEYPE